MASIAGAPGGGDGRERVSETWRKQVGNTGGDGWERRRPQGERRGERQGERRGERQGEKAGTGDRGQNAGRETGAADVRKT